MLSLARSRYTLAAQFVFLATNAAGILFSVLYNANTPDLYPNNAHHKLGWAVTWVVCAQVAVGLLGKVASAFRAQKIDSTERESFIPVSRAAMEEHHRLNDLRPPHLYRLSDDSGQGTERNTASLGSRSPTTSEEDGSAEMRESRKRFEEEEDDDADDLEAHLPSLPRGRAHAVARRVAGVVSSRFWRYLILGYNVVDRTILILGFVAFSLGVATYGRFFVSTPTDGRWWLANSY